MCRGIVHPVERASAVAGALADVLIRLVWHGRSHCGHDAGFDAECRSCGWRIAAIGALDELEVATDCLELAIERMVDRIDEHRADGCGGCSDIATVAEAARRRYRVWLDDHAPETI